MPADTYSAFISYARVDNEPFTDGQDGWVSTFVDRLRKHLARELGRRDLASRVWLDYEQMRGADSLSDALRETLAASTLLVPILSPGWLASGWCREELKVFLDQHGAEAGRIFPVHMAPTDDLPPPLDHLVKYRFWYRDAAQRPRTRWFPDIDPTDRDYGYQMQDMARDMAQRLRELLPERAAGPVLIPASPPATGSPSPPQPARPRRRRPSPPPPSPPAPSPRRTTPARWSWSTAATTTPS